MADTAAHLVDRVLPEVPVRQWVLTLPYPLRYRCAWDAQLVSQVLRAFMRALFADLRRRARRRNGIARGHCGAVTFIQRFGSALNLNLHFHSLVLDGVYAGPNYAPGRFLPLPPPEKADVARVMAGTARRLARLLEKAGVAADDDALAQDDPLLSILMAASIRSRIAFGPEAGRAWQRLGDRVDPADPKESSSEAEEEETQRRCVHHAGMSLHADVSVPAHDRQRLERLCRYVARPPLAVDRLEALPDGRLAYRMKTRWRDGTTHILMERHELLDRLAPLIPPPRAHQVRYCGVLAPCASGRDRVVPAAPAQEQEHAVVTTNEVGGQGGRPTALGWGESAAGRSRPPEAESGRSTAGAGANGERIVDSPTPDPAPGEAGGARRERTQSLRPRRLEWAELLQRIFEVDALRCPRCGGRMRILSAITDPDVARRILACLGLPPRAPPLGLAAAPEPLLDHALTESEPWDFDQTPPDDWIDGR